ncbi:hypothetical protein KKD72_00415 [Patescibacteria group bacterium]|nr:hypothetical protein [Patescibacteria group bacterium]
MDFKNPVSNQSSSQNSAKPAERHQPLGEPLIRTMKRDLASLGKGGFKPAAPPDKLPVVESIGRPGIGKDIGIKTEIDVAKGRLEQWGKAVPVPTKPKIKTEGPKKIDRIGKEKNYLKFVLGGALLVLILAAIGGFFYWKGHSQIPVPVHLVCQNFQCIEIQGEGENECSLNGDCLPAEPVLPQPLILSPKTKTIEINKGEESSFWDKLEPSLSEDETENVLERILIKMVDGFNKEYAGLGDFLSLTEINIPSDLARLIEQSEANGEDYTLFAYNQSEGKRLGLALKLKTGADLTEILKNWEKDIEHDLTPLFLGMDISNSAAEFKDNVYQGKNIRYVNFPDPDLSIDYAIIDDKLLITTSQESMYAAIDALSSAQ